MKRPFLGVALFTVAVVLVFVYVGEVLTKISGEADRQPGVAVTAGNVSPEAGEQVFWGKGKCYTCHAVGPRGNSIRGPDQGESGPLGMAIGARAAERAKERASATGKPFTATEYLVECLIDPGAYVVEGYKNEMPDPMRPPISLTPDETRAVVAYLQGLGGTVDVGAIQLPAAVIARAAQAAPAEAWAPYLPGDPKAGEELFFHPESNAGCAKCHRINGKGSDVGPELTGVAGTRDPKFIIESILEPSKVIASGYEPILLITTDGRYVTGVVRREDATVIEVADSQAEVHKVPKSEIRERSPQKTSLMPGNFGEILTVQEFHDVLAFLLTQK